MERLPEIRVLARASGEESEFSVPSMTFVIAGFVFS